MDMVQLYKPSGDRRHENLGNAGSRNPVNRRAWAASWRSRRESTATAVARASSIVLAVPQPPPERHDH